MDPAMLQVHLKRNAEDMQEYIKGLDSWENDVKKRDQLLTKQKPILKKSIPPIRGQSSGKSNKKKVTQETVEKKKKESSTGGSDGGSTRIKSYDYNAWNKFDVDAACEDTPSSSSSSEEEDIEEAERREEDKRRKMAELEKERGNQLFKEGKYQAAVERYTKSFHLDPTSHVIVANRAMAFIKLKKYAAAESDCDKSIALEDNYIKSWQRRATARAKLGKLQEALEDYYQVLKLDPSSKTIPVEIKKLEEQLAKQQQTSEHIVNKQQELPKDPKYVQPVKRPRHLRSKKPLVRVTIEEVGGVNTTDEDQGNTLTNQQPPLIIEELPEKEAMTIDDSVKDNNNVTVPSEKVAALESNVGVVNDMGVVVPDIPTTSIEFMSQWKSVRNNKQLLGKYFKSIPLPKYPVLLNQSIETNVFTDILCILHEGCHDNNIDSSCEWTVDVLQWLTKVPRFNMAMMFLSKQDKGKLTEIFSRLLLQTSLTTRKDEVNKLAKQYSIKLS